MNKFMKTVSLVVMILLVVSQSYAVNAVRQEVYYSNTQRYTDYSPFEEDVQFSEMINQEFANLVSYWGGIYPDYYAGAYIEGRIFHILVTCQPETIRDEVCAVTENPDIVFHKVSFSYNELTEARDQISNNVISLQNQGNNQALRVVSIGVDEKKNDVFVEVRDLDEEILSRLKSVTDPVFPVRFLNKQSDYLMQSSNVTAGTGSNSRVYNYSTSDFATISFCASRSSSGTTEIGFVTAGHLASVGTKATINGTVVGKVSWRRMSGNCDAEFIKMNDYLINGYVRSNILSTSYIIGSSANVGVVGTTYAFHGQVSGIIYGVVDNTSCTVSYGGFNNLTLTEQIRMVMYTQPGDSGGPLVKTASGNIKSVIGILTGGDGTYSCFTKASNIFSAMNGWLY